MLSFMRETNPANSQSVDASSKPNDAGQAEESDRQPYFTVSTRGRAVRKTTTLLVIFFAVGLLALWIMIKSSPETASGFQSGAGDSEQAKIEGAIARLTGAKSEMFSRMDEIVNNFYDFSNVQQVKVSELVKNPFETEKFASNQITGNGEETGDGQTNLLRRQHIRKTGQQMQLSSIMYSQQDSCCMIDDRILYEGQTVKGFEVCQISSDFVKLKKGDVEVVLKLSE